MAKITWNDKWIFDNFNKYPFVADLWRAYNKELNLKIKKSTFKSHVSKTLNIKSNASWTKEEELWLTENYPRYGMVKCETMYAAKFGKTRTSQAIKFKALKMGLHVDKDVISNRLKVRNPRLKATHTVTDTGNEEFLRIKKADGKWQRYHRYVYELHNGAIPDGYKVIFLDNNNRNFSIDNLVAVPAGYLALMNKLKLKSDNSGITRTAVIWCNLHEALRNQINQEEK